MGSLILLDSCYRNRVKHILGNARLVGASTLPPEVGYIAGFCAIDIRGLSVMPIFKKADKRKRHSIEVACYIHNAHDPLMSGIYF